MIDMLTAKNQVERLATLADHRYKPEGAIAELVAWFMDAANTADEAREVINRWLRDEDQYPTVQQLAATLREMREDRPIAEQPASRRHPRNCPGGCYGYGRVVYEKGGYSFARSCDGV